MDFDREYQKPRRPDTPDDFTDCNVQALIEGRRKTAAPRPQLPAPVYRPARRETDWHYDSQGYCDNPGRGY